MRARRTLLAVHAHPDDETITTGGTLARYSAAGVRTIVVTCTNGELGGSADLLAEGKLAAIRDAELRAATRRLGVSRTIQLGYADSGLDGWPENQLPRAFVQADVAEAADRLGNIIREQQPQVVVAYDETGGYGHPDHLKAHQVAVAAFQASADARRAKLYFIRFPITWSREFVRSLRQAGIDAPGAAPAGADPGPGSVEIGVPDDLVTTAIDVREYVAIKRAALTCHASQMPPRHWLMRMPPELAERLWAQEFYSRAAGPTGGASGELETDLFAGLD